MTRPFADPVDYNEYCAKLLEHRNDKKTALFHTSINTIGLENESKKTFLIVNL